MARTPRVRTRPSKGTKTKPVSSVPAMPPAVFNAIVAPMSRPTQPAPDVKRETAGNAAPSSVVGTRRTATAATAKRADSSRVSLPVARIAHMPANICASESHPPSSATITTADVPAPAIKQAEHLPRLPGWTTTNKEEAAERQATKVGGQHHRERVTARAEELHEEFRPDDLITQCDATGQRIERQREPCIVRVPVARGRQTRVGRACRAATPRPKGVVSRAKASSAEWLVRRVGRGPTPPLRRQAGQRLRTGRCR